MGCHTWIVHLRSAALERLMSIEVKELIGFLVRQCA
jgi:hypothetical protein